MISIKINPNNEIVQILVNGQWTELKHQGKMQLIEFMNKSNSQVPIFVNGDPNFMNDMQQQGKLLHQTRLRCKVL